PEIIGDSGEERLPYDSRVDVWSFGLTVFEVMGGNIPKMTAVSPRGYAYVRPFPADELFTQGEIARYQGTPIQSLVRGCLQPTPDQRFTILEAVEHLE